MIPDSLPRMWNEACESGQKRGEVHEIGSLPYLEILDAFQTVLLRNPSKLGRLCFLIDGLDEFRGNQSELVQFIRKLANVGGKWIKIIISSRPSSSVIFEKEFEGSAGLRLDRLNFPDIEAYVSGTIHGALETSHQSIQDRPQELSSIIHDTAQRSSGIFLWAVLACRSLLDGLKDFDWMSDLRRRADLLPRHLEGIFEHMLAQVGERHKVEGAWLLRACCTFFTKMPSLRSGNRLYVLGLASVCNYLEHEWNRAPLIEQLHDRGEPLVASDLNMKSQLCRNFKLRLKRSCGGLLQTARGRSGYCLCDDNGKLRSSTHANEHPADDIVLPMHRAIFDFILANEMGHWGEATTALSIYTLVMSRQLLYLGQCTELSAAFFWDGLQLAGRADTE